MNYYCEAWNLNIKPKSNYKHLKSNAHKEFERCKNIEISIENPNINDVDRILYSYIIEFNKKYN